MITTRMATIKRLGRKVIKIAPIVASNPRLLPLMRKGVHPEIFERMNGAWLHQAGIRTVLDIGANTGQFTRTMHALLPDATIYAFEPQADTYETLKANLTGSPNLHAIHTAVGDEVGETTFHQNAFAQSSSVLPLTDLHKEAFPWAVDSREVRVPITTLDAIREELDLTSSLLIKIDVQGFEDRVLRGGQSVIQQASHVLIETAYESLYEGEATFGSVYDAMNSLGFRFIGNLDQVLNRETGLPIYADALFVRTSPHTP